MQVIVENVSELSRRMTVTVEDANIEQAVQDHLNAIRPTVKMSGFRPGKVPMKMVVKSHGGTARRDVIDELVQSSMKDAFTQEEINPASPPHIASMDEKDNTLIYTMEYDIFPDVKEVKLKGIKVEKVVAEVQDNDVDGMLETLREQRMSWEPIKTAAEKGQGVTIDFVGSIDGEEFDGGMGNSVLVVIGDGTMLPEFEDQLIGAKTGQDITITTTFPKDYRAEHLQGKKASFATNIKSVAKKNIPKLNKAFAVLCGVEAGVAALKKEVRANMMRELSTTLKEQNKRKVMEGLTANNELALPDVAVEREAEFLMNQAKTNLTNQGVNVDGIPLDIENFKDNARQRVALSLLIGKIISDNKIEPEEKKVKEAIDGIATSYEDPEDVVKFYMNDQKKLSEIQLMVVEDAVVEWLYGNIKVTEKTSSFSEVMNPVAA